MSKKAYNTMKVSNHGNDGKSEWTSKFGSYNEWSKKATKGLANKTVGKPQYKAVKAKGVSD